ncbi:MAG: CRTAC1 family protein, partial [Verrucomicrobiota bacterium]
DHPIEIWEAGLIADLDNDGNADFVTVGKDGMPWLFKGNAAGKFPDKPTMMADIHFDMPTVVAAGDADADGDLDLWMTQYKLSFLNGQMPTPYYDANDGYPSYYLRNNGDGTFSDITEEAGLASLRHRRTYSASFVDLDEDGDLDLMNVSDYAGLDLYENDGKGGFRLATEDYVDDRHFFGMGHTIGDYNQDGLIDFYVIGMSSTTARRLDRLKLGRDDRPDIHAMRATMGYGNRLYFGTKEKAFREDPEIGAAVARTGWSWGTTTYDFDLDGDQDIYVANGHRSGASCQDYCTTFWRHDIYTGDSKESKKVLKVFQSTLLDLNQDKISWNGFEKNVMFANNPERDEMFANTAFMFGGAFEYDARSVISDDFNADGKPDLIVAQSHWNGRGTELIIRAFLNETKVTEDRNWFAVHLRESKGAGYSPNGAKVAITDDAGRVQTRWIVSGDSFLCQHAPVAHFGLGDAKAVESIKVTWPNGETRNYEAGSGVNRRIILTGDSE